MLNFHLKRDRSSLARLYNLSMHILLEAWVMGPDGVVRKSLKGIDTEILLTVCISVAMFVTQSQRRLISFSTSQKFERIKGS